MCFTGVKVSSIESRDKGGALAWNVEGKEAEPDRSQFERSRTWKVAKDHCFPPVESNAMGQCQSYVAARRRGSAGEGNQQHPQNDASWWMVHRGGKATGSDKRKPKLRVDTSAKSEAKAPSTGRTIPETPVPIDGDDDHLPGTSLNKSCDSLPEMVDYEDDVHHNGSGLSLVHFLPSLRHTEELDPIIPEESDPDAPSDEEEERVVKVAMTRSPRKSSSPRKSTGVSPPRPQSLAKMRHQKVTRPNSVIHHDPVEPPSPQGSVEAHTISQFRKLKVQVKLAAKQERKRRRAAKLEDRYKDVQGYKNLWTKFEQIQTSVDSAPSSPSGKRKTRKRSNSFDLQNSGTWFIDFNSFDEEDQTRFLDDDELSQSGLSLHSTSSMESQRRYFQEKWRLRRSDSEPMFTIEKDVVADMDSKQESPCKVPTEVSPNRKPRSPGRLQQILSTPPSFFKRKQKEEEEADDPDGRGRIAPTLNAFQIATGEPEYHVYKGLGATPLTDNEDTPKKRNRMMRVFGSEAEIDMNNDYQVARRRRVTTPDGKSPLPSFSDEKKDAECLGIQLPPSPIRASSSMDSMTANHQVVMRILPNEASAKGNASTGTSPAYSTPTGAFGGRKSQNIKDYETGGNSKDIITMMSTEEFLNYSNDCSLARVSQVPGYDIETSIDSSNGHSPPRFLDFSNSDKDTSGCDVPEADMVVKQLDDLLAKFQNDNTIPDDEVAIDLVRAQGTLPSRPGALTLQPPL